MAGIGPEASSESRQSRTEAALAEGREHHRHPGRFDEMIPIEGLGHLGRRPAASMWSVADSDTWLSSVVGFGYRLARESTPDSSATSDADDLGRIRAGTFGRWP